MQELSTIQVAAALVLAGVLLVLLRRGLKRQTDPIIVKIILAGAVAKALGTVIRFYTMAGFYDGRGDFNRYLNNGRLIAAEIRDGVMPEQASEFGTPFMDFISGLLFTVAPATLPVGFAVFGLLSFIGQYLFLRAFQLALPDGDHRRYAALMMFVPTMVFWPSSLGKEAWLVFTLGVASYGAARVLRRQRLGFLVVLLGGAAIFVVRPHMAALFALSFAGAYVLRFRDQDVNDRAVGWILGLAIVAIGAGYAATNFGDLLPQDETLEAGQAEQIFAETSRRTTTGGSEFESRPVRDPLDFAHALVTVPFRPFPHEGHNRQAQIAAMEGVALLLLVLWSWPRLARLPRAVLRRPYVALAAVYTTGFVIAFSNVGNFGLLTRQRAQLLPMLFVLICLPAVADRRRRRQRAPVLVAARSDRDDPSADDGQGALDPGPGEPQAIAPTIRESNLPGDHHGAPSSHQAGKQLTLELPGDDDR